MNLIEGNNRKTVPELRAVVLAQANLRVRFSLPVIVLNLVLYAMHGGLPPWFVGFVVAYLTYALAPYALLRHQQFDLQFVLLATAVLDPLMLSTWIALTGVYGTVVAGFYLFTILGWGFRTGRLLMRLCQVTSIAGFALVLAVSDFWQNNLVIWVALFIPMIVVPMYGSTLIKSLQEARDHAEQESRAKSELLAKVSHELRTPLTGIVASAELVLAEYQDPRLVERTNTILRLSDNLLCEINDLLDSAKFEANAVVLEAKPVDLREQMSILRATFDTMASKKGLWFRATLDPAVTNFVEVDAHQLDRVLLNLVGNAIKFTERGGVTLAVELLKGLPDAYHLRFSVTDTGIGIPEAFRARIFERFAQVDQGPSRRYGGTGLGLALSKKIVELMGGDLRFESNLGEGTRFWFELTLPRATSGSEQAATASSPSVILTHKRILVVDDNASNLVLLKELLEIDHHQVTACTSGMAALETLARREFDVLLLDYNLGDMDGVRVMQTYRFGRLNPAPILFLTADATLQTAKRLREAGGAGIIYKPVTLAALRQEIAALRPGEPVAPVREAPAVLPATEPDPGEQAAKRAERSAPALRVVPLTVLNESKVDELRQVSPDPAFFPRLLEQSRQDIHRCSEQLQEALGTKDFAVVRSAAHALKGVSAMVGAVRLVTLSVTLMNLASEDLAAAAVRFASDLREGTQSTEQALDRLISDAQRDVLRGGGPLLHRD